MDDSGPMERLLPSLFTRLKDDNPRAGKESRHDRVVSVDEYLRSIREDLQSLLNTENYGSVDDLERYPEAAKSVV